MPSMLDREVKTVTVMVGQQLTITTSSSGSCLVEQFFQNQLVNKTAMGGGSTNTFGEFLSDMTIRISCLTGTLTYSIDYSTGDILTDINVPSTESIKTALKDTADNLAGLTALKINFKNVLNTFTSFLTNANTAARTYTFPDKTGNVLVASQNYGWADILPVWAKDDGAGGWALSAVSGSRMALSASNTTPAKTLLYSYHIPHDIVLNQADSYFHLHWEVANTNSGNIILTAYIAAALRDGIFSSEYPLVFTLTPSTMASVGKHVVTDLLLPNELIPYLVPDAGFCVRLVRDRGTNATDTYNSTVWVHTSDIHTRFDTITTEKDAGAGWVKI